MRRVWTWGRSANATEKDSSHAATATLISRLTPSLYNELRLQVAREDRPRPYDGPLINGQDRPFPDTAFDFKRGWFDLVVESDAREGQLSGLVPV